MTSPQPVKVLIAEDDYLVRASLKGILNKLGYTVVGEAADGEKAVELAGQIRPDVVLMDITMPRLDGLAAAAKIQASCPTPVVMLTAYDSTDLLEKASAAGASAYLLKPPNAGNIERAIITALARFADMLALRQYTLELKQRNEELDAFAHMVAHDLKNPLGIITGVVDLLQNDFDLNQEAQDLLVMLNKSAGKIQGIIDSLLYLALVRQQEITPHPLDMDIIVAEVLFGLEQRINETGAKIILPSTWPTVLGHAPWVEQIWVNYLSNALKYSGSSPQIELGALTPGNEPQTARFWVHDHGPGLTPEQQARLFKPFARLHTDAHGHGLGLTIVQRIVQKLGGQVGVESGPGQGCAFFFTLPLAPQ